MTFQTSPNFCIIWMLTHCTFHISKYLFNIFSHFFHVCPFFLDSPSASALSASLPSASLPLSSASVSVSYLTDDSPARLVILSCFLRQSFSTSLFSPNLKTPICLQFFLSPKILLLSKLKSKTAKTFEINILSVVGPSQAEDVEL